MEEAYHKKIEENRKDAEERTAKKRAKRLKKKGKKQKKDDGIVSNTASELQSASEPEANSSGSED